MLSFSRSRLTALLAGLGIAALSLTVVAAGPLVGAMPASAILIDDTTMLSSIGPIDQALPAPALYIPVSDNPYHTGDAYSTGTSPEARAAWQP